MIPEPGSTVNFLYAEEPFKNRDPVELIDDALAWWTSQLALIKSAIEDI
jgi:hypothetical protein